VPLEPQVSLGRKSARLLMPSSYAYKSGTAAAFNDLEGNFRRASRHRFRSQCEKSKTRRPRAAGQQQQRMIYLMAPFYRVHLFNLIKWHRRRNKLKMRVSFFLAPTHAPPPPIYLNHPLTARPSGSWLQSQAQNLRFGLGLVETRQQNI
jgi:hypothetical protein